ncbi:MAG: potassium transporter [Aquifex sp.]|nr:MAG: potassium transporter [Aquifex sp.]
MVKKLNPSRTLLLSFSALIIIGAILLYLPVSTTRPISFLDALFTATSAVTVTGLTVLDTYSDFTLFGKLVILFLIQVGGLGYMTLTTFFLVLLGRRIGLKERLILAESLEYPSIHGLIRFLKRVFSFVFVTELTGAVFLSVYFSLKDVEDPLFNGIFHSISAFNNAGFSTFKNGLLDFRGDIFVNLIISFLIILGGIGFFVVNDVYLWYTKKVPRLSVHTKLVLLTSVLLILIGTLGLLFTEYGNYRGIWKYSWYERILTSYFMSVSARTAGFSTIDIMNMSESSQFLISLLMFIGASPGGTGGGIKTTTFVVILIAVYSFVKGREQSVVFERSISENTIKRALVILSLSIFFINFVNLALAKFENKDFLSTMFEVISAFSTVGLSVGNSKGLSFCADFSPFGKVVIIITMLVGRVGILGFAFALTGKTEVQRIKYPEARILV